MAVAPASSLSRLLEFASSFGIGTIVSLLVVAAAAAFAVLAMLGFRVLRRGPARFWLAPGYLALSLLPVAVGACSSSWEVRKLSEAISLMGGSAGAALRAGLMEALVPLSVGVIAIAGLSLLALTLLAVGRSSRGQPPLPARALAEVIALALALGAGCVVAALLFAAYGMTRGSGAVVALTWAALLGGALLALVAAAVGIGQPLRSPRGPAPGGTRIVALGAPAAVGLIAAVAGLASLVWMDRSFVAVLEGVPLGLEDSDELPPVHVPQTLPAPATLVPPPPPPPPPRPRGESARGSPTPPRAAARAGDGAPRASATAPEAGTTSERSPLRVGGTIPEPKKLRNVNPVYPAIARQARVQGIVILQCSIDAQGRVTDVMLLRGVPLLDQAAIDAVEQWVYAPTLLNGVAVPVVMTVTVRFSLD